jgi:hypothetical protein
LQLCRSQACASQEINLVQISYARTEVYPGESKTNACCTQKRTQVELRRAPRLLISGHTRSTSTSPCAATTRLRLHALYVDLAVRRGYSSPGHSGSTSTSPCIATTCHPAARALRQPCRAPRVLVSRPQRLYIDYAVRRRDIVFWAYDYFDYYRD